MGWAPPYTRTLVPSFVAYHACSLLASPLIDHVASTQPTVAHPRMPMRYAATFRHAAVFLHTCAGTSFWPPISSNLAVILFLSWPVMDISIPCVVSIHLIESLHWQFIALCAVVHG